MTTARIENRVCIITLDNPPINSLGYDTRVAINNAFDVAIANAQVDAIIISGANGVFTGGADIKEFGHAIAMQSPSLHDLIRRAEECPKPVISAINGVCMGGGTELSLGCHYRVAAPGVNIGLPEVKIGILPGAGGTQRLPRLVGAEMALNIIVSGEPVKAEQLLGTFVDEIIVGDFLHGAVEFANAKVAGARAAAQAHPRVRDMTPKAPDPAIFETARKTTRAKSPHFPAPLGCIDAIEAAFQLPIEQGLAREFALFMTLMATPESAALRHAFFAERAASKIPDVPDSTPTRDIRRVAVIGAGTMGSGIAMNFLNAGLPVVLLEANAEALARGVASIRKNYESTVKKGRLTEAECEKRLNLLTQCTDYAMLSDADLVIEAVFEEFAVKKTVFEQLDAVMKPGAILASNTSTLDLNRIANVTRCPQDVIGMHFFSPANVMRLLEVVRGAATAPDVLATVMKLAKKIKKIAVVSGVCDGFIGNRMIEQYSRQALMLLEEGASVQQVDAAMEHFGFAMGPFRMSDLAGNDIGWAIRKRRRVEKPDVHYSLIGDKLCELGRFGQKTHAGWYDYVPGERAAKESAIVSDLIATHRGAIGMTPRTISDQEIVDRLVYALVNEGAHILDEGIAARASDIDMIYLTGYGFPLWRGGPMHYADVMGLSQVVNRMQQFAKNPHDDAAFWKPAARLATLAAANGKFTPS